MLVFSNGVQKVHAQSPTNPFYVSKNTGSDANPGTKEKPWRTIQKAANEMPAGSTAFVLAGEYPERVYLTRSNLTFQAQGEVISQGFSIQADGVKILNFTIINLTDHGIYVTSGDNGIIENNKFLYNGMGGLRFHSNTNGWTVRGNLFHRNNLYGVEVNGKNHLIVRNEISNTIQNHPCIPTFNGADADGIRFHGSGHVFRKNYIHDMPDGHEGYDLTACSVEELANLENDYDNDSHTDCFQTYGSSSRYEAGHDILFEGNICELPTADEWVSWASKAFQGEDNTYNLTIRNNLIIADFLSLFTNGCHDIDFIHNTFIGSNASDSQGLKYINCVGNAGTVKNNIFVGQRMTSGHLMVQGASVKSGYNCVYLPDRNPFRSPDPGDVWGKNPRLDNNYQPIAGSPCIDAGINLGVKSDINGNRRPQGAGVDIGAHEFGNLIKLTLVSTAEQDGWLLEKRENSGKGGKINKGSKVLLVGDDNHNKQFRAILSFDTYAIPDNAVITKMILKVKKAGVIGTNPMNTHNRLIVDIKKGNFYSLPALQTNDFQANPGKYKVGIFSKKLYSKWYITVLNKGAYPFINKNGISQLRLRFLLDDNNDNNADILKLYSGNAVKAYRPRLIVEYYVQ